MRSLGLLAAALLVAATAACDNGSSTPVLAPATNTENFSGTVPMGGSAFNTFVVAKDGTVNITLTAAGPPPTITVGLGVGTPTATATDCSVLTTNFTTTQAGTVPQLSGGLSAGTYCVSVFDVGNQAGDITYAVTVSHP